MPELSLPRRMRAVTVTGPRRCDVREVPVPVPSQEQLLVQLEGCGVCGSSLPRWEGRPWFSYPAEPGSPGHEGWGRVVRSESDRFTVGDRVAFLSDHAFADYDLTAATSAVKLPAVLAGQEIPGEPLGCAMNIVRRAELSAGQTVAVIGIGFLGALTVQLAHRLGARVFAISQRPASLELARRMGASETLPLDLDDTAIEHRVAELTNGGYCDRVIEVIGLQRGIGLGTKLCRVRGRFVIAGFHQDGPRSVDMFQWNWRGLDVINAHERDPAAYVAGMSAAIDQLAIGTLDAASLITHRVPLERAGEAFEASRLRPSGFIKAVVTP